VEALGFDLVEDTRLEQERSGKRWVVVKPKGTVGCSLLLDLYGNKWDLIQPSTG